MAHLPSEGTLNPYVLKIPVQDTIKGTPQTKNTKKQNERPRPEKCKQNNIATMKGFVFRGGTLTNSKYNCTQIRRLELVTVPNMTQMFTSSGPWASPAAAGLGP